MGSGTTQALGRKHARVSPADEDVTTIDEVVLVEVAALDKVGTWADRR